MFIFTGSGGAGSDARGSLFEPEELGAQGGANGGHAGGLGGSFTFPWRNEIIVITRKIKLNMLDTQSVTKSHGIGLLRE